MVDARVAELERKERERKQREADAKLKFRLDLERQMKDNAIRKRYQPISETERKFNSQLLTKVHDFQTTGRLDLSVA